MLQRCVALKIVVANRTRVTSPFSLVFICRENPRRSGIYQILPVYRKIASSLSQTRDVYV